MLLQKRLKLLSKNSATCVRNIVSEKLTGVRDAIAARNEADRAIQEELKALGSNGYRYRFNSPSLLWRDIA